MGWRLPSQHYLTSKGFQHVDNAIIASGKNILFIHISCGLNGTINSARDGGEQVKAEANVSHWDTPTSQVVNGSRY